MSSKSRRRRGKDKEKSKERALASTSQESVNSVATADSSVLEEPATPLKGGSVSLSAQTRTEQVEVEVSSSSRKTSTKRVVSSRTVTTVSASSASNAAAMAATTSVSGAMASSSAGHGALQLKEGESVSAGSAGEENGSATILSPSGRRRRHSAVVAERLQEKEELHALNIRVHNLCSHFDSARCRDGQAAQLARVQKQKLDEQGKFRALLEQLRQDLKQKAEQLAASAAEIRELKEKLAAREKDLEGQRAKLRTAAEGWEGTKGELNTALQEKEKALLLHASELQAQRAHLEAVEFTNAELKAENERLLQDMERRLRELEEEALARLTRLLETQREGHEREKAQLEADAEARLERAKERLAARVAKLQQQVDAQKREVSFLQEENMKLLRERNEASQQLQVEREARERAARFYRDQRAILEEMLEEKTARHSYLEETVEKQTHELFSCNEINIGLKEEIAMLRKQLDQAERHHRVESPLRPFKRRRLDPELMKTAVEELRSVRAKVITKRGFPLGIVTCQYKGDWKGFELANEWEKPIRMVGWSLANKDGTASFKLPDKVLAPGEKLRVCMKQRKEASDLLWRDVQIDLSKKQELVIQDKAGNEHELLRMERVRQPDAECLVM